MIRCKARKITMFHRFVSTNSLINLFHIPGPMSFPYTKRYKTHIPTYPSMLPSCAFYWLCHVLVRESCLVLRPLSLGTSATGAMAPERPLHLLVHVSSLLYKHHTTVYWRLYLDSSSQWQWQWQWQWKYVYYHRYLQYQRNKCKT